MNKISTIGLTDEEIVAGLRKRDGNITKDYFYGYCRIAYCVYNRKYEQAWKPGMDFYSIAHEYYLSLDKHGFKQLEDRKPGVSLKTWMVNGFRFVLLDKLKEYTKEHQMQSFEERVEKSNLNFDIPDNNYKEEVRGMIDEICHKFYGRDSKDAIILKMMLVEGFKGNEISAQLGITPSAVTQRYHKMMNALIAPYFKSYFEMPESCESCAIDMTWSQNPYILTVIQTKIWKHQITKNVLRQITFRRYN